MKISSRSKVLEKYSRDKSIYKVKPAEVAFPKNEKQVIELIGYAREKGLSITPRGGGTGLSGAAVGEGIVVDFSKYMNNILKVGAVTTAQPGVLINKLRPKVERKGYMLPGCPLQGWCAIGGNINTDSVGPRSVKYGTIDEQVKSLRVVLADGRVLDTSKKIPADLAEKVLELRRELKRDKLTAKYIKSRPYSAGGYNLRALLDYNKVNDIITHLLVSSVGTLALLTEVRLKLPKYKELKDLYLLHYKSFDSLQKSLNKLLKLDPATLEYADKDSLVLWEKKYQYGGAVASIIVGFEHEQDVYGAAKDALNVKSIEKKERAGLWKTRALALPRLEENAKKIGMHLPSGIDDTCFYPGDFSRIIKRVKNYAKRGRLHIASFGHIGVGSLHLRAFLDMKRHPESLEKVGSDIFKIVKRYGGTLVGEHNSGRCRSKYLELESKKMYEYMRRLKDIFDPDGILNPKVMFDLDPITKNIDVGGK